MRELTRASQHAKPPRFTSAPRGLLQRACACGQHTPAGGECESCRQKREGTLQRAAINSDTVHGVPPIVHDVLNSPGQPLDAGTRAFMEPRFGHDFSRVRVHNDATAGASARAVDARAYTVGQNVAFGAGQYAPQTQGGKRLLAHELTHVVQQSQTSLAAPTAAAEREASESGARVAAGHNVKVRGTTATAIQREPVSDWRDLSFDAPQTGKKRDAKRKSAAMIAEQGTSLQRSVEITQWESETEKQQFIQDYIAYTRGKPQFQKQFDEAIAAYPQFAQAGAATKAPPSFPPAVQAYIKDSVAAQAAKTPDPKAQQQDAKKILESDLTWQIMTWGGRFGLGVSKSRLSENLQVAWKQVEKNLSSIDTNAKFGAGITVGIPVGAVEDIYDSIKGLVELGWWLLKLRLEFDTNPTAFYAALKNFANQLPVLLAKTLENAEPLGVAVGDEAAKWLKTEFIGSSPFDQGFVVGEIAGKLLMEVALLFVAPESVLKEVSSAARALKAGPIGKIVLEALELTSELKPLLKARGVTTETKALAEGANVVTKEARIVAGAGAVEQGALKATVFEGITTETTTMLEHNPALKALLEKNPRAAHALKLCNSPCFPEFAKEVHIQRLEKLLQDAEQHGVPMDQQRLKEFLHEQKNVAELEDAIGILESRLENHKASSPVAGQVGQDLKEAATGVRADLPAERTEVVPRQKTLVKIAHDAGVEGGQLQAAKDGIKVSNWNNPQSHIGEYGRGLDAVGRGQNKGWVVLEWKGEGSQLAGDQMTDAWLGRKLAELRFLNDPMADTLLDAARRGELTGRVYRTTIGPGGQLTTILEGGARSYNSSEVLASFNRRLASLRR